MSMHPMDGAEYTLLHVPKKPGDGPQHHADRSNLMVERLKASGQHYAPLVAMQKGKVTHRMIAVANMPAAMKASVKALQPGEKAGVIHVDSERNATHENGAKLGKVKLVSASQAKKESHAMKDRDGNHWAIK